MADSKSAIVKLATRLQRSENREAKRKEEGKQLFEQGANGLEVIVGGGLGGLVDGLAGGPNGELTLLSVPVVPVVGAVIATTSLIGYPGAKHVGSIGAGATAYWLGKFLREQM